MLNQLRAWWKQQRSAWLEPPPMEINEDPATLRLRLHHGSPRERWQAAAAFSQLEPDDAHISHLCRALSDPEPIVRWEAGRALVALGPKVSLRPLSRVLETGSAVGQTAAAEALGALGRSEAIAPLARCAETHSDVAVRIAAVEALGCLHTTLRDRSHDSFHTSGAKLTGSDAAGLTSIETNAILMALLQAGYSFNPALRRAAAIALGHFEDPRAQTLLAELESAQQPRPVREAATQSLQKIRERTASPVDSDSPTTNTFPASTPTPTKQDKEFDGKQR